MHEKINALRCSPQAVGAPQDIIALNLPASDIEQGVQTLTAKVASVSSTSEIAEAFQLGLKDYGQVSDYLKNLEVGTLYAERREESGEEELVSLENQLGNVPRPLPRATAQSTRALKLSAPDIEHAIQTLTTELGHAPTEIEIAEKLRIGLTDYWQVLGLLKDLEVGTLYAERREDSGEEEVAYLPNGPEDDPLFRCLRSEMRELLRDAIDNLPKHERLVLSFYYSEEMDSKDISVILNLAETTVSNIRASASLHIRASLATSMNRVEPEVKRGPDGLQNELRSGEAVARTMGLSDTDTDIRCEQATQVVVSGSHSGWVPTRLSWKLFGRRASWCRFFRSWYLIDQKQEITQIRRQERHTRELGF